MAGQKQAQQLARQLFRMTLVNGEVSPERVTGVLEYIEKHRPAKPAVVLHALHRYVAAEIARGQAVVEHAGPIKPETLTSVAENLGRKYGRKITPVAKRNDSLIAGLRVRVGDDVYESTVSGQLETLAAAAS